MSKLSNNYIDILLLLSNLNQLFNNKNNIFINRQLFYLYLINYLILLSIIIFKDNKAYILINK